MKGFDVKFIDELKRKNDIVDVIGKYVRLEQRGGNFWGKCPFHHEKTASFSVNSSNQFFYCFGCHKSGDVLSFIMEIESLDFNDAVKFLAERVKMPLPEVKYDDEKIREQKKQKERILELLRDTARFYALNLRKEGAEKHLEYIIKRKIPTDCVAKFGIGASLNFNGLVNHLKEKGYTYEEMTASGAVDVKDGRYYDSLGGRLIIPIINQFNQVVAFGGRLLEKADFAKYKNTRETSVFLKSNNLYNLNNLKKLKNEKGLSSVIIVEGYMDTISLVSAGINNVVASMGTSLTKDQARIIKRYTDKVFISYDGDFAGQKASIRGLEILSEEGLEVKVVCLPDGMDPDDVIKNLGAEGYTKLLAEAKPLIDFKLDILRRTYDLNTVDGKRKFTSNAIRVIRESPSPAEQEDLLKIVRDLTGTTFEALKRELYSAPQKEIERKEETPQFNDNVGDKTALASRFILASYLFNKHFARETDINSLEFVSPIHKGIKEYIVERINGGQEVKFSDLYEVFNEDFSEEVSRIAGMELEENNTLDQATYFFDCVKTLKLHIITEKIEKLSKMFSLETDNDKRRELTKEITKLLAEKKNLSK
ncbi:MAG: DNA primase [Clostridiales bacterium]|nr:DNA primase [Clostridiales bacterium]